MAWPREAAKVAQKSRVPRKGTVGCDRSKFRIVLDVGHTAEAPGAMSARNVREFDFNLGLAKRIEEKLKADGFAETSLLVTEGKAKPSLFKRATAVNDSSAKLVLSIHHDAVPESFLEEWEFEGRKSHFSDRFSGYSIFVSRENRKFVSSLNFARLLGLKMKKQGLQFARQYSQPFMGRYRRKLLDKNAGIYQFDHLVVLQRARMAAVLFEAGSIINRDEELAMSSPERQDMISAAVTEAMQEFCKLR
ncbi:N-acetylmuramoyl-L-alanine amidase family protein [Bradyrhizobium australiense]|uniref:N-acetylmuramoyl-L-alanine amidase family protein n=1 Tax=Bradyrhizobium australiense TaxID=2721161 RepID=UPI0028A2337D|nr:N-acetylmuramoyl-L-alanine amidase [Bradyrhizobium australiense]